MAANDTLNPVAELVSAPIESLISAIGRGVADAQQALDMGTIQSLKSLHSGDNAQLNLMRQFGYQPTWYRIPELDAEVTVSLSFGASNPAGQTGNDLNTIGSSSPAPLRLYAAPVDANYSNRYAFDLKAASTLRFKIVPVPAAPQASELRMVPRLKHRNWKEAKSLLNSMELRYQVLDALEPSDHHQVIETIPEEGELLRPGQSILIRTH